MEGIKFKITKLNNECFFLKNGATVIYNPEEERIYSEDGKQYMPVDMVIKMGVDGEQLRQQS